MKKILESHRRIKQQIKEKFGVVQSFDDSDFEARHAEYQDTISSLKIIQTSAKSHVEAIQAYYKKSAALSVELAAFHRATPQANASMAFGQVHAELERVQVPAIERFFEQEVVAAIDLLLWQVPEVESKVKHRRNLLLDLRAQERDYENACVALDDVQQNRNPNSAGSGLFGRRKSEAELCTEVDKKKAYLEQIMLQVDDATEWLLQQFMHVLNEKDSGNILSGPMSAFMASEKKISTSSTDRLRAIEAYFPDKAAYEESLNRYEQDFAGLEDGGLFAGMPPIASNANNNRANSSRFQCSLVELPNTTVNAPKIVMDCVDFLMLNENLNTEGLFKQAGNPELIASLRERYNAGQTSCLEDEQARQDEDDMSITPHDVCGLLKRFLNDLPESLIPQDFYPSIVEIMEESSSQEMIEDSLADIVAELPEAHIVCLSEVLQLLYQVARRSSINRMSSSKLATALAPTVIRPPCEESPMKITQQMPIITKALQVLIEQAKRFQLNGAVSE